MVRFGPQARARKQAATSLMNQARRGVVPVEKGLSRVFFRASTPRGTLSYSSFFPYLSCLLPQLRDTTRLAHAIAGLVCVCLLSSEAYIRLVVAEYRSTPRAN